MAVGKRTPVTQDIAGKKICIYVNLTLYCAISAFEPRAGDTIQATYPRSGTHRVQRTIQLTVDNVESARTYSEFTKTARFLEFQLLLENHPQPRFLCTRIPMGKIRVSPVPNYIYFARNPWDTGVSCFLLTCECLESEFKD